MFETFQKRLVAEKVWEDLKVLQIYQKRIDRILNFYYSPKSSLIGNFYSSQIRWLNEKLGSIINNCLFHKFNFIRKSCEAIPYNEYFIKIAEFHEDIRELNRYYIYLDRAIRHRTPLFSRKLELLYPVHYAFEPLYKVLISSDAISWESIEKRLCKEYYSHYLILENMKHQLFRVLC